MEVGKQRECMNRRIGWRRKRGKGAGEEGGGGGRGKRCEGGRRGSTASHKCYVSVCFLPLAKNGVVLAVEKKQKSVLYDESSINKVSVCLSVCLSVC